MKCSKCSKVAVYSGLCQKHLVAHVQKTVKQTVTKYKLFTPKDKLMIAASGGKDSLTLLDIVSSFHPYLHALAIDEGIPSYREHTLLDLRKFCKERGIQLKVVSFASEYGKSLSAMVKKTDISACRLCGVFRRQLLNKHSKGYDLIATGHNLDDELQSLFMNLWQSNLQLCARLGPQTGVVKSKHFVSRVKPLHFIPEKMVRIYALIRGFDVNFVECPHARDSFRHKIGGILNRWESEEPGVKKNMMDSFMGWLPGLKRQYATGEPVNPCRKCGQPSAGELCRACAFVEKVSCS